jgi:hypothetical protein
MADARESKLEVVPHKPYEVIEGAVVTELDALARGLFRARRGGLSLAAVCGAV